MLRRIRENNFLIFLIRMCALFLLWAFCRLVFGAYNSALIGPIPFADIPSIIRGGFVFDSVSIIYLNLLFILLSLLPLRIREREWYRKIVMWVFVLFNSVGLITNTGDIAYYPFKLSRFASDDLHFAGEDNIFQLFGTFLIEYWWAVLLWLVCVFYLVFVVRFFRYTPRRYKKVHPLAFFIMQTLVLATVGLFCVWGIRGYVPFKGTYPVAMSDVTNYVKPRYASLTLSNPFCLIRTLGRKYHAPSYFPEDEVDALSPTMHQPLDSVSVRLEGQPNVVFLVLESFGNAHIKALNDEFPADEESCTPVLDSIIRSGYTFTKAYHNGSRSIDALPSIWASIPSFKAQFLSLPQSVSEYYPLPAALRDEGYRTLFFHGAVRESMSFVAFGNTAGVTDFYSREDYEKIYGSADYDGHWGIVDHKFLPFVGSVLDTVRQPFCATVFTLSSHHPFIVPDEVAHMFPERRSPLRRVIAYSDYALGQFLAEAAKQPWFENTLFVITADHSSSSDVEKYMYPPYNYEVPIVFYYPAAGLKGQDSRVMQHINIAPTIMRMLGCGTPFFGFGRDMFNDTDEPYAIYYNNSTFNFVAGDMLYLYNEKDLLGAYDFTRDYRDITIREPLEKIDAVRVDRMKAFIQQYYLHVNQRRFK